MIIANNYVFVATPKTASASIRRAIKTKQKSFEHEHDPFLDLRIPGKQFAKIDHPHVTIAEACSGLDLSDKFKFGFVRNPFDRFVSFAAWTTINVKLNNHRVLTFKDSPVEFMKYVIIRARSVAEKTPNILPCSHFLCIDGKVAVDFVGRFENLKPDFDKACKLAGIGRPVLGFTNRSEHEDYREYYDTQLVDLVSEYYKEDLQNFGYSFE